MANCLLSALNMGAFEVGETALIASAQELDTAEITVSQKISSGRSLLPLSALMLWLFSLPADTLCGIMDDIVWFHPPKLDDVWPIESLWAIALPFRNTYQPYTRRSSGETLF